MRSALLERMRLENVRCHEVLEMSVGEQFTFVVGANGSGKTSVLEAVTLAFRGSSPRAGKVAELVRHGADIVRVRGEVVQAEESITSTFAYSFSTGERKMTVNGATAKDLDRWLEILPLRTFFPDDLELVKGGPHVRRRFVDEILVPRSTEYRQTLRTYEDALRQRNMLLRRGVVAGEHCPWEEILARSGVVLVRHRADVLKELAPRASQSFADLTGRGDRPLSLVYRTNASELDEEQYQERLASLREADRRRTFTQIGPHRDDVRVLMDGADLRERGSQGEQRAGVLALLLGEHRWAEEEGGRAPLLLLDDVMSELDLDRRGRILALLGGRGQVIVTSTGEDQLAGHPSGDDRVVHLGAPVREGGGNG